MAQADPVTVVTQEHVEAERAVVGSLLIDPDAIIKLRGILPVEAFYDSKLGWIYGAIINLADRGVKADILTVCDELADRKQLADIGGASFVMALVNSVPTSIHAEHYAGVVRKGWERRDTVAIAQRIVKAAMNGSGLDDAAQMIADARKKHSGVAEGPQSMATIVDDTIRMASEAADNRQAGRDVVQPTPFLALNKALAGGMMAGDVVTVIGSPGIGKSTFVQMCADNAAAHGTGVLAFITEMNRHQYAARQIAPSAKVDSRTIRSGAMSSEQWERVWTSAGQVGRHNFLVDDKTFDATQFEARIEQAILMLDRIGKTLGLVVFDYLQLFRDSRRKDKRVEVGDIINGIREIANAYEVPAIVVSSLAREGYKNDAKPNLYNSKESGDIEYATTIGLAMWREPGATTITMEIQKNRDGKAWEQFQLPPMIAGAAWYDVRQQ